MITPLTAHEVYIAYQSKYGKKTHSTASCSHGGYIDIREVYVDSKYGATCYYCGNKPCEKGIRTSDGAVWIGMFFVSFLGCSLHILRKIE